MTQLKGIDISHWETVTDWNALAKDIQFVYLKATEGYTYMDPKALDWFNQAKAVGLKVGFYHFASFQSIEDATTEADFFVDKVGSLSVDLPLVLDIETDPGHLSVADLTTACIHFLERVKTKTGKPVMVYTYPSFIKNELAAPLGQYPLWYANYSDGVLMGSVWVKYAARQYTDSGKVAGINGGVDLDLLDDGVLIQPPAPKPFIKQIGVVTVLADNLNVRADHDIHSKIIEVIHKGHQYKTYGNRFGWYNIGAGWVSQNYVRFAPIQ